MANNEYTAEGFDQDTINARIEMILESWGIVEPESGDDDGGRWHESRNRAYEMAVQFPNEISDELFEEYLAAGLVK